MITDFERTRRSLHGVAELLLAGPSYRAEERIRLAIEPHGFATVVMDGPIRRLHVHDTDLVLDPGSDEGGPAQHDAHYRIPLVGTFAEVAHEAGIDPGMPDDVYADHTDVTVDDDIVLDATAVRDIIDAFVTGDAALRKFAAAAGSEEEPILWPEHFDVAITIDEVNYGVSAGDSAIAQPYAYVGPWQRRSGAFWNVPFGAARTLDDLGGDPDELVRFFTEGWRASRTT